MERTPLRIVANDDTFAETYQRAIAPVPQFTGDEMIVAVAASFLGGSLFTCFTAYVWSFFL